MEAKEPTADPFDALNQIEQVRADAARTIAEAEELCQREQETLTALRAEQIRLRFLVRVHNSGRH